MRYNSYEMDDACENMFGHNNWAYADTVPKKILERELKAGNVIIFFDEPQNEDGEDE